MPIGQRDVQGSDRHAGEGEGQQHRHCRPQAERQAVEAGEGAARPLAERHEAGPAGGGQRRVAEPEPERIEIAADRRRQKPDTQCGDADPQKVEGAARPRRGWSLRYGTPEDAIKAAMDECAKSQKAPAVSDPCELFAVGDIVVRGMSGAEQRAAAEIQEEQGRDERRSAAPA